MFHERMVEVSSRVTLFTSSTDGPAEKTLLVIHGGPDWDHSYLREPLSQLAGNHRVVLPDLRGCARSTSDLDDGQYTPDAVVGGLIALVDELSAPQVAVLGFSYGGLIAQRLTVTAPERVSRMVIASSSVLPVDAQAFGEWPEREERLAAEASAWADPSLSGPELTRAAAIAGASANVWRAAALPGYPIDSPQSGSPPNGCGPGGGTLPSPRRAYPIPQLGSTGIPVLMHGRQDMVFPSSLAERAAALLPRARAVVLDQAGHMAHFDRPQAWLAAIASWLDEQHHDSH